MAFIEVEIEEHLYEVDTKVLVEELKRREVGVDMRDGRQIAQRLRGAFYRRDASQFEAILIAHLDPVELKACAA